MIRAALDASPWGIANPVFAPFTLAYPASTLAALTAYWVTYTRTVLAFEAAHPQACLRVRFEDLTQAQHETTGKKITAFLGIADMNTQAAPWKSSQIGPASQNPGPETDLPADLIPPSLLAQANDLLRQLNYPALAHAENGVSP